MANNYVNFITDEYLFQCIGNFHEEILGGIEGYEKVNYGGCDIKANDNTLFADIKNKHNTMNSGGAESLYQKLERIAKKYPNSKCYLVQILAKSSFNEEWEAKFIKIVVFIKYQETNFTNY